MITQYQPEYLTIEKSDIYAAREALRNGIEYSEELLAKKDWELGREHKSNRETAERIERDIAAMRMALIKLKAP